jgi:hypothetical protein
MSDPFSDRYWTEEFQVTEADLERIVQHVRQTGQAHELTALARRVVRGRLRHGPESSAPVGLAWAQDPSVRLWDPSGEWEAGDHAIVAVGFTREGRTEHEPFVAEVTQVQRDTVTVQIDALDDSRQFTTTGSPDTLAHYRRFVENLVEARRGTGDVETQTGYVLLEHGEWVISQLLEALRADERFVRLAGRWFLRDLAVPPSERQLAALAWAMVPLEEPTATAELVPLIEPALAEGNPGLFGLYLAMRERPELFENADPGKRPRWVLAAPPPGAPPTTPRPTRCSACPANPPCRTRSNDFGTWGCCERSSGRRTNTSTGLCPSEKRVRMSTSRDSPSLSRPGRNRQWEQRSPLRMLQDPERTRFPHRFPRQPRRAATYKRANEEAHRPGQTRWEDAPGPRASADH